MESCGSKLQTYDLAATTIAKAICGTIPQITSSDCGVLVPLTEELASHIVEMYNNTDWDGLTYDSVSIPEDIFTGEMDVEAWNKHIGEHILISYFGSPWSDIMDASAFVRGITIDFSDHLLELAADYMDDLCSNDTMFRDLVDNLILGIQAKLADGIPEKALRRILELEFGSRKSQ